MLLNRSAALLLLAVFGFTWVQAFRLQHPRIHPQSSSISITEALSSIQTPLPFNPNDGPESNGEQGYRQRFNVSIGRDYVLPFIVSAAYDTRIYTLEEKATIMAFITHRVQNLLTEYKIQSDDLVDLLNTLIVKDEMTTLQRLSGMIDQNHQDHFNNSLTVIKVHQSNIAAVLDLLKSYQTIDVWRTSLQKADMDKVLGALYENVASLSTSSRKLWEEFYLILNM